MNSSLLNSELILLLNLISQFIADISQKFMFMVTNIMILEFAERTVRHNQMSIGYV